MPPEILFSLRGEHQAITSGLLPVDRNSYEKILSVHHRAEITALKSAKDTLAYDFLSPGQKDRLIADLDKVWDFAQLEKFIAGLGEAPLEVFALHVKSLYAEDVPGSNQVRREANIILRNWSRDLLQPQSKESPVVNADRLKMVA